MIQIFLLGSSHVYGVGAETSGWADLVKQALHKKMYSENGIGEKYEIYNFGFSGATIDFVRDSFPEQLKRYSRGGEIIIVVSIGGNNAKAKDEPDNFVSSVEEYVKEMNNLLEFLKKSSNHVIMVGSGFYDESKTNPKTSPFDGRKSYFTNARKKEFQKYTKKICLEKEIIFVDIGVTDDEWKKKYLYRDGLHSNQQGHEYISKKVLAELSKLF
ncbi:MAG: SGNH/GDSL hydrolase family protein [Parcubacteria group bacterium]|jgi:lysophospholipase L1-like esterase